MNKRQVKKILGLLKDGMSPEYVLAAIIELSENSQEAARIICDYIYVIGEGWIFRGGKNE